MVHLASSERTLLYFLFSSSPEMLSIFWNNKCPVLFSSARHCLAQSSPGSLPIFLCFLFSFVILKYPQQLLSLGFLLMYIFSFSFSCIAISSQSPTRTLQMEPNEDGILPPMKISSVNFVRSILAQGTKDTPQQKQSNKNSPSGKFNYFAIPGEIIMYFFPPLSSSWQNLFIFWQ